MHVDPKMMTFVVIVLIVMAVAIVLKLARQPYVVAYILAGVLLGPDGLGIMTDRAEVNRLGAFGVIFLLFFIGMEVSPQKLIAQWKISVLGAVLPAFVSIGGALLLGWKLGWSPGLALLIGFIISLSSTAVVLKVLEDRQESGTQTGTKAMGILLIQDILVVPMLIVINFMGGESFSKAYFIKQILGLVFTTIMMGLLVSKKTWKIPLARKIRQDHELQVFAALALCFGFALITGLLELSAPLGAFIAGMFIGASKETEWVHDSLHSFRVIFVSLFFLSIGMLVDLTFVRIHFFSVFGVVLVSMIAKTLVNGWVFRLFGETWKTSLYGGAVLAQIGEFGFILAAVGYTSSILSPYGYQLGISAICLSLLISPLWISLAHKVFRKLDKPLLM